ncbi:DUF3224 domain-containing protein [candidate division KSB1 bacterium]|nr:DUF3224 domain-containing protein [candidate division KSB1 bacterium]
MKTRATATFEIKNWKENPFNELEGAPKLMRASVSKVYHGELEGEGTLEYLMIYNADGSANYFGYERVVGKLGARSGSFVLEDKGVFEGGMAKSSLKVMSNSGTGELRGLRGEGSYATGHAQQHEMTFDYEIP